MKNKTVIYKYLIILFCVFTFSAGYSQTTQNVGIGTSTPNASAILDLESTELGFLVPRQTSNQRIAIPDPAHGLIVFDIDSTCIFMYDKNNTKWINLCKLDIPTTTGVTTSYNVVTDIRDNAGTIEKKTKTVTVVNGVITAVSAESAWTP